MIYPSCLEMMHAQMFVLEFLNSQNISETFEVVDTVDSEDDDDEKAMLYRQGDKFLEFTEP